MEQVQTHYSKSLRTEFSLKLEKQDRAIYIEFKKLTAKPFVQKSQVAKSLARKYGYSHFTSIYSVVKRVDRKIAEGKMLPINI